MTDRQPETESEAGRDRDGAGTEKKETGRERETYRQTESSIIMHPLPPPNLPVVPPHPPNHPPKKKKKKKGRKKENSTFFHFCIYFLIELFHI